MRPSDFTEFFQKNQFADTRAELVIDHSVQMNVYGSPDAASQNTKFDAPGPEALSI